MERRFETADVKQTAIPIAANIGFVTKVTTTR
jgi:hypothetical protein